MRSICAPLAVILCISSPLPAVESTSAQAVCPAAPTPIPQAYERWTAARAVASAESKDGAAQSPLAMGEGTELRLHPDGEVTYLTLPKGAGEAASFGGLAQVIVGQPGAYRLALGDFVWVDLVRDGKPVSTAGFGHGPACTPIRKVVDFDLQPGKYTLEVSGSKSRTVRLMIMKRP